MARILLPVVQVDWAGASQFFHGAIEEQDVDFKDRVLGIDKELNLMMKFGLSILQGEFSRRDKTVPASPNADLNISILFNLDWHLADAKENSQHLFYEF